MQSLTHAAHAAPRRIQVRNTFALDQGQFQSLVSNEVMSIARKHKRARQGAVRCHGAMAGNTLPENYMDDSGSAHRRVVLFLFATIVVRSRSDLQERMRTQELAAIMRKVNWCYQSAAILTVGRDLRTSGYMTEHMHQQQKQLAISMHPLRSFLTHGSFAEGEDVWCPEATLVQAFREYCSRNSLRAARWETDFYVNALAEKGCAVKRATYQWDGQPLVTGNIVHGLCLHSDRDKGLEPVTICDPRNRNVIDVFRSSQAQFDAQAPLAPQPLMAAA